MTGQRSRENEFRQRVRVHLIFLELPDVGREVNQTWTRAARGDTRDEVVR